MRNWINNILLCVTLLMTSSAVAQTGTANGTYSFVITNGTYFLANQNGSIKAVTPFDPTTCIWTCSGSSSGTLSNNGYYLYYQNRNGLSLSKTSSTTWTINGNNVYYESSSWFSYKYYIRYNNNSWSASISSSNRASCYPVAVVSYNAMSSLTVDYSNSSKVNEFEHVDDSRDYYAKDLSYTPAYNSYSWTASSGTVTYYTSADNSYITQDGAPTAITTAESYAWSSSHPNNVTVTQSESEASQATAEYTTKFSEQTVWTITATATIAKSSSPFMTEDATVTGSASATLLSREIADLSVTVDKYSLYVGQTAQITVTTGHDGTVSYSSANTAVAAVSDAGLVTAVGTDGNESERVLITVSIPQTENYEAAKAMVAVTVKKRPVTMALKYDKSEMTYGDALPTLTLCTLTDGVDNKAVTGTVIYSSSSTGVSVNASTGAVIAVTKAGKATITAQYMGDDTYMAATATFDITVDKATTTLSFAQTQYEAQLDKSFTSPQATLSPAVSGGDVTYSYTSDTDGLITLDQTTGQVTLSDKAGIATVTATFAGDDRYLSSSASYTLVVSVKAAPTLTADFSKTEFYVDEQGSVMVATNSTNGYTLVSSDTEVMTVDSKGGLVAVGAGTAVIRVTSLEDDTYREYTKDYTVTVKKYPTNVVSFEYPSLMYYTDYEDEIRPTVVVHEMVTNTQIPGQGLLSFDATSPTVLTVKPTTGVVTLVGEGFAAIGVSYEGNYKYEASEKWTWMMVAKAATPSSFIRLYGEDEKYLSVTNDGGTYKVDTTSVKDASSILWYGEDGSLLFYECGRYLNADKTVADVVDYGTGGTKFTFTRRYDDYTISAGGKQLLDSNDSAYWRVVDVESLPLQFKSAGNGFSTFYTPQDLRCPSGMRAYYPVSRKTDETDDSKYIITLKQVSHSRIPCETPVILYTEDVDSLHQLYLIDHTESPEDLWDGMTGTLPAITTASVYDGTNYPYTLQPKSSSVGFYPWKSDKHAVIEPFRCYIPGESVSQAKGFRFVFGDDGTVGIEPVADRDDEVQGSHVIYNMQGMAVGTDLNALPAGIYVSGGTKVVVGN